jgi:hypothetical protein
LRVREWMEKDTIFCRDEDGDLDVMLK